MMRKSEDDKAIEAFYDYFSGNKVRIYVEGQNNNNNFYVICNGSTKHYVQLFKEGFETNTPIFLTSAETGAKLIINPRAVFNVGITEIKREN